MLFMILVFMAMGFIFYCQPLYTRIKLGPLIYSCSYIQGQAHNKKPNNYYTINEYTHSFTVDSNVSNVRSAKIWPKGQTSLDLCW